MASRKDSIAYKLYQANYRATHKEQAKQHSIKHRLTAKCKETKGKYWLKRTYGLTIEGYKDILVSQDFKCAVCGIEQRSLKRRLVVDHNHVTGKVRGLLCNPCNNKRVDTVENFGHLIPVILEYLKRGI